MYTQGFTIEEYIKELGMKKPIPGGGGVSAINACLSAALAKMVINFSLGKKEFLNLDEEFIKKLELLEEKEKVFFELANKDAEVFEPLSKAYSIKVNTEEEKINKQNLLDKLLYECASVPIEIIENTVELLDILEFLLDNSNKLLISDIGVSILNLKSAIMSAQLNILVNLRFIKNEDLILKLRQRVDKNINDFIKKADIIYKRVLGEINV